MNTHGYRQILNKKLVERRKSNPSYSLRAFSRDIDLSPQLLSLILSSKRKLPEKYVDSIVEKLDLNFREELLFKQDIANERGSLSKLSKVSPAPQTLVMEEIHYKLITEWEYYAVYTLLETNKTYISSEEIAKELNLSEDYAEIILNELMELNLIKFEGEKYSVSQSELNTSWNIPNRALRQAQKNNMDLAKKKIDKLTIEKKQFSSATLPIAEGKVDEVKKMIQDFQNRLSNYVRKDKGESVYQLNIQFFSLTDNENMETKNEN